MGRVNLDPYDCPNDPAGSRAMRCDVVAQSRKSSKSGAISSKSGK